VRSKDQDLVLVAVAALAVATACAVPLAWAQSGDATQAVGVLETSAGAYEFTPVTCVLYQEDGFDDIEIGGRQGS